MLSTYPQSTATVAFTETPEAKDKVVSVLTCLQRFLPKAPRDPREQLAEALRNIDMHLRVEYAHPDSIGMVETPIPHMTIMRLTVQPSEGHEGLCDGCEVSFMGAGRTAEEAWAAMVARVLNGSLF